MSDQRETGNQRTDGADRDATVTTTETVQGEREMEQLIGRLLQIGVLLAAAVVILGGVALLAHHGQQPANFRVFRDVASPLRSLGGIVHGAIALDSSAIVQLGLVLLIATPVARVALTLVAFVVHRDRLYVAVTTVVLALLLYGLVWGT